VLAGLGSGVAAALAIPTRPAAAAARAEPWMRWATHDETSTLDVDHGAWTQFLQRYVAADQKGINRVAYAGVKPADRVVLGEYLHHLQRVKVDRLRRDEQRTYWINLYNALTVATVLEHYPVDTIRDISISPGWFSRGPWGAKLARVAGEALSLDDVEHRILRPLWRDARIHYALNCASLGCPNLRREAFETETIEAVLETAAREFVNHPRAARVDRGRLFVSSLYVWSGADFGATDADIVAHIRHYAEPELRERLEMIDQISGDDYDWRLNDQATTHGG
jgi:hypothetical protein